MMKRLIRRVAALLLPLSLLLSIGAHAALLPRYRAYIGQFPDVTEGDWFYPYVTAGYEYGLFEGRGKGFDPNADVTVAELLALSARLRAAYEGDTVPPASSGEAWYVPYVAYLNRHGLLPSGLGGYTASATRAQLAGIFSVSLPDSCFDDRNAMLVDAAYASGRYIADVEAGSAFHPHILWMYSQGLLVGMDANGSYRPAEHTTRAEVAAVVTRMVDPGLRLTPSWPVLPDWSAAGTTLPSLIDEPMRIRTTAPALDDADDIDELVRAMLASGENRIELFYSQPVDHAGAQALADVFMSRVKRYCEQMYNAVECRHYTNSGQTIMIFSATACDEPTLATYRARTMNKAVEVHDALWANGTLRSGMSQRDMAAVYYQWLCDNCAYDMAAASNDYSPAHLAYSALLDGTAVCDGYTGAYNLFLKLEGIDCYGLSNRSHIWTVAVLDGEACHIDVTWGDQSDHVDWSYFAMTPELSAEVHQRYE